MSDLITEAAKAAYPELFDPNNKVQDPVQRSYAMTDVLQRISKAVEVVQQASQPPSPVEPDPQGAIVLNMFAPDAQIVTATLGIVSFLDSDGVENYALAHSDGAGRAVLLGMLAMASHEIVTAPAGKGPTE